MELLKRLTQCNSPSGNEGEICEIIKNEVSKYADEVYTDVLGNLIARKKGEGKKIMYAAHMDEIGIVVTFIDENGFLRFSNVGGLTVKGLANRQVCFSNGTVGVIGSEEESFNKKASISKLFIDIGAKNREEAEKYVSVGDTAMFMSDFALSNNKVITKALDNRVGCYVLIECLKRITDNKNDLYFVFTVQEEVGIRGAKTATYAIAPDIAIALDVTDTGDTPNCPAMAVKFGGGACVKVMDRSVICHSDVRTAMIEMAKSKGIKYQLEIMTDGGTDAGAMHLTHAGIKTGGISIPTRYIHAPCEMADIDDINSCIDLAYETAMYGNW